jgi:CheY-like chemotaxis protein
MKHSGDIIFIDDDMEDLEIFQIALKPLNLPNNIRTFVDPLDFLEYIKNGFVSVFFIACDINMPKMNGFELRRRLLADDDLRLKTVPFIFLSTSSQKKQVLEAYELAVQGYFIKPSDLESTQTLLENIIKFWDHSSQPGDFDPVGT